MRRDGHEPGPALAWTSVRWCLITISRHQQEGFDENRASIKVSEKVQEEDEAICDAVQRGLASRAYVAGGCRCGAKRASICFTGCSMRPCWRVEQAAAAD